MDSSTQTDPSVRMAKARKRGWEKFLPKRPLRVLLVEDDDATRQVVCALLCKCGYEVNPVANGLKAWDLMERADEQFDLVLTDAAMPIFSGTDLLAKIMISEAHRDTPVIMMSAQDSLEVVFKCLLRGAKDFLVKPLRRNELRNLWQHVWRRNSASHKVGRGSAMRGKRRKVARLSVSGEVSTFSGDDISQNSDRIATSQSDKGSATQSLCHEPPAAEKDIMPTPPDKDLTQQQGCTKYASEMGHVQEERNRLRGNGNPDPQCLGCTPLGGITYSPQCVVLSEGSEASERSAKAIDLIGTMTVDSRPGKEVWDAADEELMPRMSESTSIQGSVRVSHQPQSLELTLKRSSSSEDTWCCTDAKNSVKQSDYSAFSRYNGGIPFLQQQCAATVTPLSSDQCALAEARKSPKGDGALTTNTKASSCVKPHDRKGSMVNCATSTLHFPRAVPFQQGRQEKSSNVCLLASHNGCDEKQADNEKTSQFLRSPLKSSSVNSSAETGHTCPHDLRHQFSSGASPGSLWSPRLPEVFDKDIYNDSCSHVEYKGQQQRHCHPQSSSSVLDLAMSTVEGGSFYQKVSQWTPSGIETAETEIDTLVGLNVSGSGSNTGSNDGSNSFPCHLKGQTGKPAATQESCSFGDFVKTDETSVVNFNGAATSDADVHCAMLPPEISRSTLREAALNKFRQKRKVRCFEKKVRYQSRKKLAEQRPRVKGQFVRQAVYDASLSKLEHDMVCC